MNIKQKASLRVQEVYGDNIETLVAVRKGQDHCPEVTCGYELPDGKEFEATASNKRIACDIAAKAIIYYLDGSTYRKAINYMKKLEKEESANG